MKTRYYLGALLAFPFLTMTAPGEPVAVQEPVVRMVFFFSPTCRHCELVMSQHLPVFFQIYGGTPDVRMNDSIPDREQAFYLMSSSKLEMLLVDATKPDGGSLYEASMVTHPVEERRKGVPRLILGDSVLVGETEIPGSFHRFVRRALADGGLDWPEIPGLPEALAVIPKPAGRD
jgi:hypothetical protein